MAEDWSCKANPRAVEPEDCDWPNCGCDPHAARVMAGLVEQGWLTPRDEDNLRAEVRAEAFEDAATIADEGAHYGGNRTDAEGLARDIASAIRHRSKDEIAAHEARLQKNISNAGATNERD